MVGLNLMIVTGNLGADPEMRYTADGTAVTTFPLAVSTATSKGEETIWLRCICWRGLGETVHKYLTKGSRIFTMGKLRVNEWEDADKVKRTSLELVCNKVQFLDPKKEMPKQEDEDPGDIPF